MGLGDVLGEQGGLQAVCCGVGEPYGFLVAVGGEDGGDGAEDFLSDDGHVRGHAVKDGGRDEQPAADGEGRAAGEDMPPFGLALLDVAHDRPELAFAHDGAEVVFRIERVADAPVFKLGEQGFGEGVLALAGHDDPGVGGAVFAHVPEGGSGGLRGDGGVVGPSSSTTKGLLPPSSSTMRLRLLRAAYSRKRRPTSVEPVKDTTSTPGCSPSASPTEEPGPVITLNTPSGMPASAANSASFRVESEVTLAGLRMTLLPSAKGGAELPAHHHEREVPRQDAGDHPGGLAHDEPQPAVSGGGRCRRTACPRIRRAIRGTRWFPADP